MRIRFAMSAVLAAAVVASIPAAALDMPSRKPGLWEMGMSFEGGAAAGHTMTSQHCIDANSDKAMNALGSPADKCTKMALDKTASGYVFDSECDAGTGPMQSHGVITGSFDSAYTMDITAKHLGAPPPGMPASSHMKIAAKWLGTCKADQKPGDVIMPNGMKMNLLEMKGRAPGGAPPKP
ncbi:MAG: DUF3617 domain-containing protein [Pseudolabrys sp.]